MTDVTVIDDDYVLCWDPLRILNVSDAYDPFQVGYYNTPGDVCGADMAGNLAYVADKYSFRIYDCAEALPVGKLPDNHQPEAFTMSSLYPNPFNSSLDIEFQLQSAGNITLTVYDVLGREVTTLRRDYFQPGVHHCTWNAENAASGVYLVKLTTDGGQSAAVQKAVLLK